jgi:hypothetical protein
MHRIGRKNTRGLLGPLYQTDRPAVKQLFYTGLAGLGLSFYPVKIGMVKRLPAR